jgi:hypothetical protein
MKKQLTVIALSVLALVTGCSKNDKQEVDTEYPVIDMTTGNTFPQQCSEIKRGETFVCRLSLSDNMQLGSVSVDVHHNFDHHTHSTEIADCSLEQQKRASNPFLLIKTFDIPAGLKSYELSSEIAVPADVDAGDYHFSVRVTDKEGWQTVKGLSIKVK